MKTLHELATKLQEYIIRCQTDMHNATNMSVTKYNNLKLKMDTKIHYPHVIIRIGISEATYNIADGTKTDGSLGPDEKYARKWLGSSTVIADLKEIYIAMSDFIKAEDEGKSLSMEGESDEAKADLPNKKGAKHFRNMMDESGSPLGDAMDASEHYQSEELLSMEEISNRRKSSHEDKDFSAPETIENMKESIKDYIKSMFRKK